MKPDSRLGGNQAAAPTGPDHSVSVTRSLTALALSEAAWSRFQLRLLRLEVAAGAGAGARASYSEFPSSFESRPGGSRKGRARHPSQ